MTVYSFGPYRISTSDLILWNGSQRVVLPRKVAETLVALLKAGGNLVTKRQLMSEVWPDADVEESNLTQGIYLLRRSLSGFPSGYIETLPRRGYRITVPIEAVNQQAVATGGTPEIRLLDKWRRAVLWCACGAAVIVGITLGFGWTARKSTHPLVGQAFASYELGLQYLNRPQPEAALKSRAYLSRLVHLEPNFAEGYALLSQADLLLADQGALSSASGYNAEAAGAARKALALDAGSEAAHAAMGAVYAAVENDAPAAEVELTDAITNQPGDVTAHRWLARLLFSQGRLSEARREFETVLSLRPQLYDAAFMIAWSFYLQRDYQDAIAYSKALIAQHPAYDDPVVVLALSYEYTGRYDESIPLIRLLGKMQRGNGNPDAMLAQLYARLGSKKLALAQLQRLHRRHLGVSDELTTLAVASTYALLGDSSDAFAWLVHLNRSERRVYAADPRLDPLRRDARFRGWSNG